MTARDGNEGGLYFSRVGISKRLWIGAVAAVALSTILAGIILAHVGRVFLQARHDVAGLEQLRRVLVLGNRISAERTPSNVFMATEAADAQGRLRAARKETDQAIAVGAGIIPAAQIQSVVEGLMRARKLVDLAADQSSSRYIAVQHAVDALFSAYDAYQAVVVWEVSSLIRSDPELAGPVRHALILCVLRDDAGRLGSTIIAPLIAREAIPQSNIAAGERLAGRIAVYWQLLALDPDQEDRRSRLATFRAEAEAAFFREGQPLVNRLIAEGIHGDFYTESAVSFSDHYVEALRPLEVWRTAYLDTLVAHYAQRKRRALDLAVVVGVVILCVIGLIASGVMLVHLRVLRPLLEASEAVVGLLHDQPIRRPLSHYGSQELKPLFDAVQRLDIKLREWAANTRHLRQQAETDELTGLFNRRAFRMFAKSRLDVVTSEKRTFIILLDIDHFKSINDRYGHMKGDRVLVAIAAVLRKCVRPDDLVARIGGEEFAVLTQVQNQDAALSLAHRLRYGVEDLHILSPEGVSIPVTASFGVSGVEGLTWRQMIAKADVALYAAKQAGRNCIRLAEQEAPVGSEQVSADADLSDRSIG